MRARPMFDSAGWGAGSACFEHCRQWDIPDAGVAANCDDRWDTMAWTNEGVYETYDCASVRYRSNKSRGTCTGRFLQTVNGSVILMFLIFTVFVFAFRSAALHQDCVTGLGCFVFCFV